MYRPGSVRAPLELRCVAAGCWPLCIRIQHPQRPPSTTPCLAVNTCSPKSRSVGNEQSWRSQRPGRTTSRHRRRPRRRPGPWSDGQGRQGRQGFAWRALATCMEPMEPPDPFPLEAARAPAPGVCRPSPKFWVPGAAEMPRFRTGPPLTMRRHCDPSVAIHFVPKRLSGPWIPQTSCLAGCGLLASRRRACDSLVRTTPQGAHLSEGMTPARRRRQHRG